MKEERRDKGWNQTLVSGEDVESKKILPLVLFRHASGDECLSESVRHSIVLGR